MKKFTSLLAVVLMIFAMTSGLAMAAEGDITGTWYAQSVESDGITMDADVLSIMGMSITITLNEDGTVDSEMAGDKIEGVWNKETIELNGRTVPYKMVGDQIELENEGSVMILGRQEPELIETMKSPVVEDPEMSDFDGKWNTLVYSSMGFPIPLKMMGFDIEIEIKDAQAVITETSYDIENNYKEVSSDEKNFIVELDEDGTLFIPFDGEEMLTGLISGASGLRLTLHEDGRITGEVPELTQMMQMMADSTAQAAGSNEAAENAEGPFVENEEMSNVNAGDSDGSSSGETDMSVYIIFKKAK